MNLLEILRKVDFFKNLEENKLLEVSKHFEEIKFIKGEIIFEENSIGDRFYILTKGKIEVMRKLGFEGRDYETELSYFEPYNYFGEMALFDNSTRSATVKAAEECVLLQIKKDDFLNLSMKNPEIVLQLIKTISFRMRATNDKYMEMWDSLLKKNKMAAIGNAAAKIVHDIKTPITVIILTAQMVEKLFPNTEKFNHRIIKQTEMLNEMIKEILDFARGKQSKLDREFYEISEFFEEIQGDIAVIGEQKNIKIVLDNRVEKQMKFDFNKIKRTVVNIIKNAFEAIGKDGKIFLRAEEVDNKLRLSIEDTGPGIPDELLGKIFDPFVTSGKETGTGLGLAICNKVVNDHGGRIKVGNVKGGGAKFEILLPQS